MSGSTEGSPEDQREHLRVVPFVVQCRVTLGSEAISAYILNPSQGGALIAWPTDPPPSETGLTIVARFRGYKAGVRLPAQVAWGRAKDERAGTAMIGVNFPDLPATELQVIDEILSDFKSKAALLVEEEAMSKPDVDPPFRRAEWTTGPSAEDDWLALTDDELLYQIEALDSGHDMDAQLVEVVTSNRHFFVRQEAAKKLNDPSFLKKHAQDRHIGQILVRVMNRKEDIAYLEAILAESRHLEVRKTAKAQLDMVDHGRSGE